jgi:hypothetical protein
MDEIPRQGVRQLPRRNPRELSGFGVEAVYHIRVAKSEVKAKTYKTGKISFGKLGARNIKHCGGKTPAMEVIFTATAPGGEAMVLDGDDSSRSQ